MTAPTVADLGFDTRTRNVLLPLLPFVAFSEPHEEQQARLLALPVDRLRTLLTVAAREELKRWPITNGASLQPFGSAAVRGFRCAHCAECVRRVCCNCGRKRGARLPHRRFERSGAAAVMTFLLRAIVRAFWKVFARRPGPPLSQLSRAGHLPLFPSTQRNPEPAKTEPAACGSTHLPRRVSSSLSGSGLA